MSKDKLCLFTTSYPFGNSEPFLENELIYLAQIYDEIYLFHYNKTEVSRTIPYNVRLVHLKSPTNISVFALLSGNWMCFISIIFNELFFSRQKKLFVSNFKYNISFLINCILHSNEIKKIITNNNLQNATFYSYWFFNSNLSLSILKYNNIINNNVTRAHGFDLYENNGKPNYLPYRKFCFKYTNKVIVISKTGAKYLSSLYKFYNSKIYTSYLGTMDYGFNPIPTSDSLIHIVSCSNVCDVKRIHLIVDILKHVNVPLKWTHIGDGVLLPEIKNLVLNLPNCVSVEFKGRLQHNEIMYFYRTVPINFFINTSVSEGISVSIMEAISFGIPIVATNVGGTSEIVNDITGLLLEVNFNAKNVAKYLTNKNYNKESRENIKMFWSNNFCADNNYPIFCNLIY